METDQPPLALQGDSGQRAALRQGFALGDHVVQPTSCSIQQLDRTIHLGDQSMAALVCLAEHAGSVVSQQQLEQCIGQGDPLPAGQLADCISELRQALEADIDAGDYIETVTGRGYRLRQTPLPGTASGEPALASAPVNADDFQAQQHDADSGEEPGVLSNFWRELKQRRVFRVSATYIIMVWAVVQAADVILPILNLPSWLVTVILLIGLLAFPAVVLVAWTTQWDSSGLHFDLPEKSNSDRSYRHFYLVMIVSIFATIAVLSVQLFERVSEQSREEFSIAAEKQPSVPVAENSLAVLRFANLSGQASDSFFSDGLSEELLHLLARLRELRVASRTSSWSLPDHVDIASVRDRLQVAYVLEGSVRRSRNQLRITAQLISTADGFHLWSQTYDREIGDILAVQVEIANKVTNALQVLISADRRSALNQRQTTDPKAYEAYLQGMQHLRMPIDGEVLAAAEQFFLTAKTLDPTFAQAWSGLCKTYIEAYGLSESATDFARAEAACNRTLTLDETRPDIFEALGNLYTLSGKYQQAEQSYDRALVLAPNSAEALIGLGQTLEHAGDLERTEKYFMESIKADPGYWKTYNALGGLYFDQGRAREAIPYFRQVVLLAPGYSIGLNNLAAAYFVSGQYSLATETFAESIEIKPNKYAYSNSGTALFLLRKFDEAASMYRLALEIAPEDYLLWGNLGDALSHNSNATAQARVPYRKAAELAQGLRDINSRDPYLNVALARYFARLGQETDARRMVGTLDDMDLDMYIYYDLSLTYIALDDLDAALAAAREAITAGFEVDMMIADPGFDPLRSTSEFRNLARQQQTGNP